MEPYTGGILLPIKNPFFCPAEYFALRFLPFQSVLPRHFAKKIFPRLPALLTGGRQQANLRKQPHESGHYTGIRAAGLNNQDYGLRYRYMGINVCSKVGISRFCYNAYAVTSGGETGRNCKVHDVCAAPCVVFHS